MQSQDETDVLAVVSVQLIVARLLPLQKTVSVVFFHLVCKVSVLQSNV